MFGKQRPSSYIALFRCRDGYVVTRGSIFKITEGVYAYVGSCGNHCSARIVRHLHKVNVKHWHVDYLHDICDELAVVVLPYDEGNVARAMLGSFEGVPGFGNSDRREDKTHLFRVGSFNEDIIKVVLLIKRVIDESLRKRDLINDSTP